MAITILKAGTPEVDQVYEKTCYKCGCVFSHTKKDVHHEQIDGYFVVCPMLGCDAILTLLTSKKFGKDMR
jgi:hypothetical protein